MKKRLLCLALVLVMLVGIIPFSTITVLAAGENETVPVTGVELDYSYYECGIDEFKLIQSVETTVYPSNASNKIVVYESSDPSVVYVERLSGGFTALKAGTATITFKTQDGNFTDSMEVNVIENCGETEDVIFTVEKGITKVLLIKRKNNPFKDMWALVGGALYNDETIDDAMKREILEKVGLKDIKLTISE